MALVFVIDHPLGTPIRMLPFQPLIVLTIFPRTIFLNQRASCMPRQTTNRLNILERRTVRKRSAYIQRLGQKKSAVNGTSMSAAWAHSPHSKN